MTSKSTEQLRRDAKALRKAFDAGDTNARALVSSLVPGKDGAALKHADFLHVVARGQNFASWPALVAAAELHGLDQAQRIQRLIIAMAEGQSQIVTRLLEGDPALATVNLPVAAALYEVDAVRGMLAEGRGAYGSVPPFIHFCRSRMFRQFPDRAGAMLEVAEAFWETGVDLDAGIAVPQDPDHTLSPLYFALGHAGNIALAEWLLTHGANPNDNESLYHATELGDPAGVRLLLAHGADARGTNALLRAMDFDDAEMVAMLLAAGADPNEFAEGDVGGEAPFVVPALHQAARRMSSKAVVDLLMDAGARPDVIWQGKSAHAYAAVYGNIWLAERLEAMGADTTLTPDERPMADAARGHVPGDVRRDVRGGQWVNPDKLVPEFRGILRNLVHLPGKLPHMRRLVALGVEYDLPSQPEGLTPVQTAGWEGLPEVMGYFLSLSPDLSHVNGYGGTLLSTIIHGSENCPARAERDHVACVEMALFKGVALPRRAVELAGDPEVASVLADWAKAHPGQVVEHGPA